jgi:hypothetical protein
MNVDSERAGFYSRIPYSSLDTTGSMDVSDTINHYIQLASEAYKDSDERRGYLILPSGTYLIESPIKLMSGVNLIGAGVGQTIINCNTGEGKPCISISPLNEGLSMQPVDTLSILKDVRKGDLYLPLDTAEINPYQEGWRYDKNYTISVVKQNEDDLIHNTWAKGYIRETGFIKKIPAHFLYDNGPIIGDTQFYQLSNGFSNLDDPYDGSDYYRLVNNYKKDSTKVFIYNTVYGSGVKCLSINRLDTTTTQTANIRVDNATACEIIGIESKGCNFAHIDVRNTSYSLFKRNLIRFGNNYGGGGKAYGIVLQSGSCRNNVVDNVLHNLRHSILLQSGANNNVIFANYSFDPYWEQSSFPSDAAGDIVLHGNYPFANVFEANIAQQIVIDDSHGKNGPFNIFHRNWLQSYGIFMSAPNGSDSQVFTGNEITNTAFLKGLYVLQDKGHHQYGNWVKGNNEPKFTTSSLQRSVSMDHQFYEEVLRRTGGWWALTTFLTKDSIPFGEPLNAFEKTIPAYKRKTTFPKCADSDDYYQLDVKKLNRPNQPLIYPNPSDGSLKSKSSGLITLYNINGSVILQQTVVANQTFNIPQKGLFVAHISTEHGMFTQKLIIQ